MDGNNNRRETYRKSARLRHRTLVNELFKSGRSVYSGPLRLIFRSMSDESLRESFREDVPDRIGPVQIMITVPKKKRRHAVDRVLMRRRIREAIRREWHFLRDRIAEDDTIRTLSIGIIYQENVNNDFETIRGAVASGLKKMSKKLNQAHIAET